jgi:hypothetical protein
MLAPRSASAEKTTSNKRLACSVQPLSGRPGDESLEGERVEGNGKPLNLDVYMFMTLTLDPHHGWRVFGVGGNVPPDAIHFGASLAEEIEPYQSDWFSVKSGKSR